MAGKQVSTRRPDGRPKTAADSTYRYSSAEDYAEAYGYSSPAEYEAARANYDDKAPGHHPWLCSGRCPCKTRQQDNSGERWCDACQRYHEGPLL